MCGTKLSPPSQCILIQITNNKPTSILTNQTNTVNILLHLKDEVVQLVMFPSKLPGLVQLNAIRPQCWPLPHASSLCPGNRTTGSTTGSTLPALSHTNRLRGSRILLLLLCRLLLLLHLLILRSLLLLHNLLLLLLLQLRLLLQLLQVLQLLITQLTLLHINTRRRSNKIT